MATEQQAGEEEAEEVAAHVIGQLPTVSEVANRKGLCYAKEGSLG
jgi:hypothetical protein